jgi:hypothetical protein
MHPLPALLFVSLGLALLILDSSPLVTVLSEDFPVAAGAVPSLSTAFRRRRGRPRKYAVPSRAVTLTLPEAVISRLSSIHQDLSRAIVGLAERQEPARAKKPAELLVFGKHAVITIRPTPSLEARAGVQLVPMPDGRALISFDNPQTLADLELTIDDALADRNLSAADRLVYEGISSILKDARRSTEISLLRRNIIVIESSTRRPAGTNGGKPTESRKSTSRTTSTER